MDEFTENMSHRSPGFCSLISPSSFCVCCGDKCAKWKRSTFRLSFCPSVNLHISLQPAPFFPAVLAHPFLTCSVFTAHILNTEVQTCHVAHPAHAHKLKIQPLLPSKHKTLAMVDNQTYFSALITILISKAVRMNNLTAYG